MVDADEILTNGHAGMLNDSHRHQAYRSAIKKAIKTVHEQGVQAHVLDIGTGTGLLALYAADSGAEFVVACESNHTMANIARGVFKDNTHRVESSSLVVESVSSCDLDKYNPKYRKRFNVIVSEVYDSELIGEGCLITYKHALQNLASDNCIFIPARAVLYAQPVNSESLLDYCFNSKSSSTILFDAPWEIHVDKIQDLTPGVESDIWHWNFDAESISSWTGCVEVTLPSDTIANGIVMWWVSDIDGENRISTAPSFNTSFQEFRDHWMPLFYPINPTKGDISLTVQITNLQVIIHSKTTSPTEVAAADIHYRHVGLFNSPKLRTAYLKNLQTLQHNIHYTTPSNICYIGATKPAMLVDLIRDNTTCPLEILSELTPDEIKERCEGSIVIDSCFNPFCLTAVAYYYRRQQIESAGSLFRALVPNKTVLFVTLVSSTQLHNRAIPPQAVDGFNISRFSSLVTECLAGLKGEDMFEPLHLWEYDYKNLTVTIQVPGWEASDESVSVTARVVCAGEITNAILSLGFYFGDTLIQFDDTDYFNKIDCYTFVEKLYVEKNSDVCIDFKLYHGQIISFNVCKL